VLKRSKRCSKERCRHVQDTRQSGLRRFFIPGRAARKVKEVKIDDANHETDDIGPIQTLTTSLAEINEASLAF
jgi:hypothetical protein